MRTDLVGGGRRAWGRAEAEQWSAEAKALRDLGVKAPIAGSSHWRREAEYSAAMAAAGLDLVDDRLYWRPPPWGPPARRSMLWDTAAGLASQASRKRKADRPYVVGEWATHTGGAWAAPFEGADLMLAARTAAVEDWDAIVRRGVYLHPAEWGAAAPGTGGGPDIFPIPETINADPSVFALLPHAASLVLRGHDPEAASARIRGTVAPGRLVVESPRTAVVAGWEGDRAVVLGDLAIEVVGGGYAVVALTALGPEPLARANRLLVTVVARSRPTGLTWADSSRRDVANPGRPPIQIEPVRARVSWKRKGAVEVYSLDSAGDRTKPTPVPNTDDRVRFELDTKAAGGIHWEVRAH